MKWSSIQGRARKLVGPQGDLHAGVHAGMVKLTEDRIAKAVNDALDEVLEHVTGEKTVSETRRAIQELRPERPA